MIDITQKNDFDTETEMTPPIFNQIANNVIALADEVNKQHTEQGTFEEGKEYNKNDVFVYDNSKYLVDEPFTSSSIPDFSKVYILSRKEKYDYFTIEIDTKSYSNPSRENGGITYFGGCEGFSIDDWVEWLGYKPCILSGQGGVECYLDPNDYSKDINGNDADITSFTSSRNVMIMFPRVGIASFNDYSNKKATIHITNDKNAVGYNYKAFNRNRRKSSKFFVGAYQGSISDDKLFSISGSTRIASGNSLSTFRTLAQAQGINYGLFDHTKLNFCKMLYIIQNGKINGKLATGIGTNTTTGFLNTSGMNVFDETQFSRKWLGMESNCDWEFIDGCGLDSNLHLRISNNSNYSDDVTSYEDFGRVYTLGSGYTGSAFLIDDEIGITSENYNGTAGTYFHCPCSAKTENTIEMQGGSNIFEERFSIGGTTVYSAGARLCFMN